MQQIIDITFKDEDEAGSEPIGPVTVTFADSTERVIGWYRLSEAQALATHCGLFLERF